MLFMQTCGPSLTRERSRSASRPTQRKECRSTVTSYSGDCGFDSLKRDQTFRRFMCLNWIRAVSSSGSTKHNNPGISFPCCVASLVLRTDSDWVISGLRHDVHEIWDLLGFYASPNGSFVPNRWYESTIRRCVISQWSQISDCDSVRIPNCLPTFKGIIELKFMHYLLCTLHVFFKSNNHPITLAHVNFTFCIGTTTCLNQSKWHCRKIFVEVIYFYDSLHSSLDRSSITSF